MSNLSDSDGECVILFEEEGETLPPANADSLVSHEYEVSDTNLKQKLRQMMRENILLQEQTESQHKLLLRLGQIVQACKDPTDLTENIEADFLQGKVMSPEDAVALTIYSLRQRVETMEDERDALNHKNLKFQCEVQELRFQKEAHLCKIQALEALVRKMEKDGTCCIDTIKTDMDDTTETISADSDSSV